MIDATVATGVMLAAPSLTWPILIAAASIARIAISAQAVRVSLAG